MVLLFILGSSLVISIIAFIGILTLIIKEKLLNKVLLILVSFAAGTLMGNAFLHLIPKALEKSMNINSFLYILTGFVLFFVMEIFYWRHCHKEKCNEHAFRYLNLVGDGVHNFIDGLILAASFIISVPLGVATALAIAFHEIPQEIGDFGILVYGGFDKTKALILNFITALTIVVGGVVGYFISSSIEQFTVFLLPLAAGGFIYIASADLIPELRKEISTKSLPILGVFLAGILLMLIMKII